MKKSRAKLRSRRGETFSEILVALLIVALATMLLVSMATASQGIDTLARQEDKDFYEAVTALETDAGDPVSGGPYYATISGDGVNVSISVNIREKDGLKAYTKG